MHQTRNFNEASVIKQYVNSFQRFFNLLSVFFAALFLQDEERNLSETQHFLKIQSPFWPLSSKRKVRATWSIFLSVAWNHIKNACWTQRRKDSLISSWMFVKNSRRKYWILFTWHKPRHFLLHFMFSKAKCSLCVYICTFLWSFFGIFLWWFPPPPHFYESFFPSSCETCCIFKGESHVERFHAVFFFVCSSSCCLSASRLKYSITVHEGSGQTQEAQMIGSAQISMGMCDQSLLLRAFPSLHLLLHERVCVDLCMCVCVHTCTPVSNCSRPKVSPQFPLTSWPLRSGRRVNAAFNQFYCLLPCTLVCARAHEACGPIHPSLLTKCFIRVRPIALNRSFSSPNDIFCMDPPALKVFFLLLERK